MTELEPQNNERVDQAGAVASTLCAIHCAICALLPAAFGALGLGMLLSQTAEWAFTLVAVAIAAGALVLSWRQHRSVAVAGLLSLGIVGLLASRVLEMGSDHHHHGDHHGEEHHNKVSHAEDAHHDSKHHADKHEDHHDERHVADGHEHEDHSSEKHHDNLEEEHHGDHEGEEDGHSDDNHTLGASVGIVGGMLLLFGHILNIGTGRKRKETCEEECSDQ